MGKLIQGQDYIKGVALPPVIPESCRYMKRLCWGKKAKKLSKPELYVLKHITSVVLAHGTGWSQRDKMTTFLRELFCQKNHEPGIKSP